MKSFDALCDRWNFPRASTPVEAIRAVDSVLLFDSVGFGNAANVYRAALWHFAKSEGKVTHDFKSALNQCRLFFVHVSDAIENKRDSIRFNAESKNAVHGRIDFASKISRDSILPESKFGAISLMRECLSSHGVSIRPIDAAKIGVEKTRIENEDRRNRNETTAHPWKRSVGNPMDLPQGSVDSDPKSHRPHSKVRRFEIASNLEKKPQDFSNIENPFVSVPKKKENVRKERSASEILAEIVRQNRIR